MSELVRAVTRPLPSKALDDPATLVAERRARRAAVEALRAQFETQREAIESLDPSVGRVVDRAF